MNLDDIINNSINGDRRSCNLFFAKYKKYVASIVRNYTKNADDIEDYIMMIFCKIFSHLGSLKIHDERSVLSWIKKTSIRTCLTEMYKLNNNKCVNIPITNETERYVIPYKDNEPFDNIDFRKYLNEKEYSVFERYYYRGMSHSDISSEIGITAGASKTMLCRVRNKIKNNKDIRDIYEKNV